MQVEEAYQQLETQQIQAIKRNLLVSDQLPVYQQLANIKTSLYLLNQYLWKSQRFSYEPST